MLDPCSPYSTKHMIVAEDVIMTPVYGEKVYGGKSGQHPSFPEQVSHPGYMNTCKMKSS